MRGRQRGCLSRIEGWRIVYWSTSSAEAGRGVTVSWSRGRMGLGISPVAAEGLDVSAARRMLKFRERIWRRRRGRVGGCADGED